MERKSIGEYGIIAPAVVLSLPTIAKIHTHSRSPTDHSCVGRNLTLQAATPRRIRRRRQTTQYQNTPTHSRYPHRPFLRRQESHSHMLPIMPKSTNNPPSPTRPFLRKQESLFITRQRRYSWRCCHPLRPFLRRQESHNHVPPTAASLRRRCRHRLI